MRPVPVDWDAVYCLLIERTGWTWDTIDSQMDLPRFLALDRHWRRHPPLRDMVQAYLGIEPPLERETSNSSIGNDQTDLDAFIELFQAAGGSIA